MLIHHYEKISCSKTGNSYSQLIKILYTTNPFIGTNSIVGLGLITFCYKKKTNPKKHIGVTREPQT
jgi:hypothetical protein